MTMTDTEAKALALVNEVLLDRGFDTRSRIDRKGDRHDEALCRAIEREEATEARYAAELREQAERFSEAVCEWRDADTPVKAAKAAARLHDFILPAPDPLVEGLCAAISDMGQGDFVSHETLGKALSARGYELRKIGEAGESPEHITPLNDRGCP